MSRVISSYCFTQDTDINITYITVPAGRILLDLPHEEALLPFSSCNATAALLVFLLLPTITLATH